MTMGFTPGSCWSIIMTPWLYPALDNDEQYKPSYYYNNGLSSASVRSINICDDATPFVTINSHP